jgi:hypothetical protein
MLIDWEKEWKEKMSKVAEISGVDYWNKYCKTNTAQIYSKFIEVTPEIENIIRDFVISRSENGIYREKEKAAVIWWEICFL